MMELDPKYCDVIIKRWETLTGEKAVLLNGLTTVNDLRGNLYTVIVDGEILLECVDYKDIGVMLSSYLRNPGRFKGMY